MTKSWRIRVSAADGAALESQSRRQAAWEASSEDYLRMALARMSQGGAAPDQALLASPGPLEPIDAARAWLGGPARAWEREMAAAKAGLHEAELAGRSPRGAMQDGRLIVQAAEAFCEKSAPAAPATRCALALDRVSRERYAVECGAGEEASRLGWMAAREEGAPDMELVVDAEGVWRLSGLGSALAEAAGELNRAAWPFSPWRVHGDGSVEFHPQVALSLLACATLARAPWTGEWLAQGAPTLAAAASAAGVGETAMAARLFSWSDRPFEARAKPLMESSMLGRAWSSGWVPLATEAWRPATADEMVAQVGASLALAMASRAGREGQRKAGRWTLESLWAGDPNRERARALLAACEGAKAQLGQGRESTAFEEAIAAMQARALREAAGGGERSESKKPRL